jgi:CBS domain-containing protein
MQIPADSHNQMLDFIRAQPPFRTLSGPKFALIDQTAEALQVDQGSYILSQGGAPSQYLYLIRAGAVRYVRDGQIIQVLEEGEMFGYPSMLSREAAGANVIAEEPLSLYRIPEKTFRELIDNAQFAEYFLENLSERLRHTQSVEINPLGGDLTTPVGSLSNRAPVTVPPTATVALAAQIMRDAGVASVLVTDEPPGIITDRDFRIRVLAAGLGPETSIYDIMSRPLRSLPVDTPVHGAMLFMLEENIHHLALTEEGQVVGIVTAGDILRHQAKNPLYMLKRLEKLENADSLAQYALEIAGMVETLFKSGLGVRQIGRVIASLNDALMRRLLRLAEEEFGPPPTPYAWIVFGSEGRMEQLLLTDQDNALVYLKDSAKARSYFEKLGRRVVDTLIQAGFPPCPGGYMATRWNRPLAAWERLFESWVHTPEPKALLEAAIFFDFRAVHGELSLEPLERIILEAKESGIFLAHMANAALEFRPPLGFFSRIRTEEGFVDLKAGGITPVVSLARIFTLEAGGRSRSTLERLEAAAKAGTLSQVGAETLIETYRFFLQLRLRDQLAALKSGQSPDNKVQLEALSPVEKRHLKEGFLAIREMQEATSHRLAGMMG